MYRLETDFRVTDSEALLSSQFLHLDSSQNSLPGSTSSSPRPRPYLGIDQSQAYGSLSSFHTLPQPGHNLSSSPLTALRNAPYMGTGPSTPPGQITTPYTHIRSPSQTSLSRLKDTAPLPRRPSVTFMQPFKAPSLGSSPSVDIPVSPRPGSTRSSSGLAKPSSLKESFIPQAFTALEDDTPPPSPSLEGERKRYSSSFSARRERRESFHSASRLSTDIQRRRFSGISISSRPEESEQGSVSSGSYRGDEEDVGLFLRMVEGRKELKSVTGSTQRDLDRFRGLRDGYGALEDSVSGSIYIPKASPPATIARSIGSGESPHTPVIRSRLSEGVILMEENARDTNRPIRHTPPPPPAPPPSTEERDDTLKIPSTEEAIGGAKPLDIPNSPSMRSWGGSAQASHHHRATSYTDHRLNRRQQQQQDQEISHQLLEDEFDSARRHSSSLGSIEGIPQSNNSSFQHRRKSSNVGKGRPSSVVRSSSQAARGSSGGEGIVEQQLGSTSAQGSLREKFCSAFASGEEGDEGEELLFAMSDMMGDKR
jgi:autophagy-related protein 13